MKDQEIREGLRRLASEFGPDVTLLAQVKTVGEDAQTCELYDEESGLTFYGVRLRPVLDGSESVTIVPKVDAWVLAVRIEGSEDWMVISVGEAEKVVIQCDQIVINGGENGGLVNWPEVKAELDKVKQFITDFKSALSTPVNEPGNGSPSAFQTALNSALSSVQTPDFEGKEDDKVTH